MLSRRGLIGSAAAVAGMASPFVGRAATARLSPKVELFGHRYASPIFLCPLGYQKAFNPGGEVAVGRAAKTRDALQILSTVSSSSIETGDSVQVTGRVTASQNATGLVDLEIYDQNWHKVYQRSWDNQAFRAAVANGFSATWTVPSGAVSGKYTVMVGVFAPGWKAAYSFNNGATTFMVP